MLLIQLQAEAYKGTTTNHTQGALLESDQSNTNNVEDGNKLNVLESDQSDLESDQLDLESDQSNTTNAGNESKGKMGRMTESK